MTLEASKTEWSQLPVDAESLNESSRRLPNCRVPRIEELKGMTVSFILGAGFSRDFNPKVAPLSSDFMATAEANGALQPKGRHQELVDFISQYFGDYSTANVEAVATFLSSRLISERDVSEDRKRSLYSDLLEVI